MKKIKIDIAISERTDVETEDRIRYFFESEGFTLTGRYYVDVGSLDGTRTNISFEETSKRARERFSKKYGIESSAQEDKRDEKE